MPSNRGKRLAITVSVIGVLAVGITAIKYQLELFVLPWRFREVLQLEEACQKVVPERWAQVHSALDRAVANLIQIQRPEFENGFQFRVEPVRTHEGGDAFLSAWHGGEEAVAGGARAARRRTSLHRLQPARPAHR